MQTPEDIKQSEFQCWKRLTKTRNKAWKCINISSLRRNPQQHAGQLSALTILHNHLECHRRNYMDFVRPSKVW